MMQVTRVPMREGEARNLPPPEVRGMHAFRVLVGGATARLLAGAAVGALAMRLGSPRLAAQALVAARRVLPRHR